MHRHRGTGLTVSGSTGEEDVSEPCTTLCKTSCLVTLGLQLVLFVLVKLVWATQPHLPSIPGGCEFSLPPAPLSVPAGSPLLAHSGSREPMQMFPWTEQKPFLSAKTHTGLFAAANGSVASKAMWFWSGSNLIWSREIKSFWPSCCSLLALNNSDSKTVIICLWTWNVNLRQPPSTVNFTPEYGFESYSCFFFQTRNSQTLVIVIKDLNSQVTYSSKYIISGFQTCWLKAFCHIHSSWGFEFPILDHNQWNLVAKPRLGYHALRGIWGPWSEMLLEVLRDVGVFIVWICTSLCILTAFCQICATCRIFEWNSWPSEWFFLILQNKSPLQPMKGVFYAEGFS